jgi:hypothetical protein
MAAESFLRVIHEPRVFGNVVKALVYNGEEERIFGADAAYWSQTIFFLQRNDRFFQRIDNYFQKARKQQQFSEE